MEPSGSCEADGYCRAGGLVGALTVVLCIVGCAVLAVVDGRQSGYW